MRIGGLGCVVGDGIVDGGEGGAKEEEGAEVMVDDFDRPGAGGGNGGGSENWRYVDERDKSKIRAWEELLIAKRKEWGEEGNDGDEDGRQEIKISEEELLYVREIWEMNT